MGLFALTMNPTKSPHDDLVWVEEAVDLTAEGWTVESRWSVGARRRGIGPGDRAVMLRQEIERGLVGVGVFVSEVYQDEHWLDPAREANYADVEWQVFLRPENRLPIEVLQQTVPTVNWNFGFQSSGNEVLPAEVPKVMARWDDHLAGLGLSLGEQPEEAVQSFREGDQVQRFVNRYERNPKARSACLAKHGYDCSACGLRMDQVYGDLGKDYVHVHHVTDLSTVGDDYEVDPLHDLVPLCPNCHAMIHRASTPARSVDDLRQLIAAARKRPPA